MSKKIKSFTVEEDLYSAAAKIAKNELKMSVSQLIEHLLSGFVDGHYKVEKKQTLQTVNRPISLTRKQLIYILTTVFSDKGYVLKPHTRDGKCYYEISKDNGLLCVWMIVMRDMRHTSCVYQVSADLTAPLLNYVQEKNILFSSAGVKIAPILFTYAITPNNIFTWNIIDLFNPLFDIPQKPKESIYPIYRAATNIGENDREPGTYFIRVKTPNDIEYGINLTKVTLAPYHGLYEELDLALRQAHEYQQETIEN